MSGRSPIAAEPDSVRDDLAGDLQASSAPNLTESQPDAGSGVPENLIRSWFPSIREQISFSPEPHLGEFGAIDDSDVDKQAITFTTEVDGLDSKNWRMAIRWMPNDNHSGAQVVRETDGFLISGSARDEYGRLLAPWLPQRWGVGNNGRQIPLGIFPSELSLLHAIRWLNEGGKLVQLDAEFQQKLSKAGPAAREIASIPAAEDVAEHAFMLLCHLEDQGLVKKDMTGRPQRGGMTPAQAINAIREYLERSTTPSPLLTLSSPARDVLIPAERVEAKAAAEEPAVQPAPTSADAGPKADTQKPDERKPVSKPRKLLSGWHEIAAALEMKHNDRKKIKRLNDRYEGPITNQGKGTQPRVYYEDLIEWWNKLAIREQELANNRDGARASTESQHKFGRDGTVAPEIGGGVKKRRRTKPT